MDYNLISALEKSNQMVAVDICLIKTPDVDNVSPWPLIHNDLHTAARKTMQPNAFTIVTGNNFLFFVWFMQSI
jgi:hypothetical protein